MATVVWNNEVFQIDVTTGGALEDGTFGVIGKLVGQSRAPLAEPEWHDPENICVKVTHGKRLLTKKEVEDFENVGKELTPDHPYYDHLWFRLSGEWVQAEDENGIIHIDSDWTYITDLPLPMQELQVTNIEKPRHRKGRKLEL